MILRAARYVDVDNTIICQQYLYHKFLEKHQRIINTILFCKSYLQNMQLLAVIRRLTVQ